MGYWKDKKKDLILIVVVFGGSSLACLFVVFGLPYLFSVLDGIYMVMFVIVGIVLCILALFLIDFKDYKDKNKKVNDMVLNPKLW